MAESEYDRTEREWREVTFPRLQAEAEAMIPEILAEQPGRLAELEAALVEDRRTYEFRCERWGDFLALFVKRGPEPDASKPKWQRPRNHIVCAINLADSQMISLNEGLAPDLGARCFLSYVQEYESSGKFLRCVIHKSYPDYGRSSGQMIHVNTPPDPPNFSSGGGGGRSVFSTTVFSYGGGGSNGQSLLIQAFDGCAQTADDDQIIFAGAGVTLYVPFGRGQEIYEAILQAVRVGGEAR